MLRNLTVSLVESKPLGIYVLLLISSPHISL